MNPALNVYCSFCGAGPGEDCFDQRRAYSRGQGATIKTPHKSRTETLAREFRAKRARLAELEAGLSDLVQYLHSEKFAIDHSVNREDVILRLRAAKGKGVNAEMEIR